MDELPENLYRAAELRAIERRAMQELGLAAGELMERAGHAAWLALHANFPRARRIRVVCGPGNNGGDGLVLARHAKQAGLEVEVLSVTEAPRWQGEAGMAFKLWEQEGGSFLPLTADRLSDGEVVVDALFGIGLERAVEDVWRAAVEAINACGRPVFSLDIPSGLHTDTGQVLGGAVRPRITLSFIGLKIGMFTGQGREYSGKILFDDLGVTAAFAEQTVTARRITAHSLHGLFSPRARHAHKGEAGRVLVIGGQAGMGGAAQLTGSAAYRAGAGLVVVATDPAHAAAMSAARPELIVHGVHAEAQIAALLTSAQVLAIGPGLGRGEWGRRLLATAMRSGLPMVIDADALNILSETKQLPKLGQAVLTPHPGEAARLLGLSTSEIQADRIAAAQTLAARFETVCVLKGSGTIVVDGRRTGAEGKGGMHKLPTWLCDRGNPGLATGGSGDVLTGVIAALMAQGLSTLHAACLGVWAHASAGDRLAHAGERGLLASDLLAPLRRIINDVADHVD